MVHAPLVAPGVRGRRQWLARAVLALAGVALAHGLVAYLVGAARAIGFPYELDYGEGIVWQQMRMMMSGEAYGAIDGFPAIVFHYPPLYHALTATVARGFGMDQLAAGRLLSVAATGLTGWLAALIVARSVRTEAETRTAAWICGGVAGLIVFNLSPVVFWSVLMRVDMVALALSFAGMYFGLRALSEPRSIYLAALCFVAAVYTKQTAVAAPAAVFATLLFLRPRTAWAGIAACVGAGLVCLALLQWATDGGFVRHILLYNINRFVPERLMAIVWMACTHIVYLGAGALGVLWHLREHAFSRPQGDRRGPHIASGDAALLMIGTYLLSSTLMLATVAKSGSSINYFIEWLCVLALLVGIAMRGAARIAVSVDVTSDASWLAVLLPLAIVLQLVAFPLTVDYGPAMRTGRRAELDQLSTLVRSSPRPVISDDMVMLLRSGQQVLWEPAIFAELASSGAWNEQAIVDRIRAGAFGFFITVKRRGDPLFGSRYNPAVADAMDAAYPVMREFAGYTLHLPQAPQTLAPATPPSAPQDRAPATPPTT